MPVQKPADKLSWTCQTEIELRQDAPPPSCSRMIEAKFYWSGTVTVCGGGPYQEASSRLTKR